MKKVNLDELCKYFSERAIECFGEYYTNDVDAWLDDIRIAENNADEEFSEDKQILKCHMEVSNSKNKYIVINFVEEINFNKNDEIIKTEYYIY